MELRKGGNVEISFSRKLTKQQGSHILEKPWINCFIFKALKVLEIGQKCIKSLKTPWIGYCPSLVSGSWSFLAWQTHPSTKRKVKKYILARNRLSAGDIMLDPCSNISLKTVAFDLENPWKYLKFSYRKSMGTLNNSSPFLGCV